MSGSNLSAVLRGMRENIKTLTLLVVILGLVCMVQIQREVMDRQSRQLQEYTAAYTRLSIDYANKTRKMHPMYPVWKSKPMTPAPINF